MKRNTGKDDLKTKEVKPLSEGEVDILMCRLQGALWNNDKEKIKQILSEVRARAKELGIIKDSEIKYRGIIKNGK